VSDRVKGAETARPATIRDVAARPGVSDQTVSRVINDNPSVTVARRARVLTAIQDLACAPSPMARGLLSNQTRSIGVVADDVSDQFFARVVAGAEADARRRGHYLMIGSVEPDDDEVGHLRPRLERRVEGLIVARPSVPLAPADLLPARSARVPLVGVGSTEVSSFPVVDVDNRPGRLRRDAPLARARPPADRDDRRTARPAVGSSAPRGLPAGAARRGRGGRSGTRRAGLRLQPLRRDTARRREPAADERLPLDVGQLGRKPRRGAGLDRLPHGPRVHRRALPDGALLGVLRRRPQ
jgi:hypothetical protein